MCHFEVFFHIPPNGYKNSGAGTTPMEQFQTVTSQVYICTLALLSVSLQSLYLVHSVVSSYELSDNEGADSLSTPSSSSKRSSWVGFIRVSSSESDLDNEATNRGWHKRDFKPKQEQYLGHFGLNLNIHDPTKIGNINSLMCHFEGEYMKFCSKKLWLDMSTIGHTAHIPPKKEQTQIVIELPASDAHMLKRKASYFWAAADKSVQAPFPEQTEHAASSSSSLGISSVGSSSSSSSGAEAMTKRRFAPTLSDLLASTTYFSISFFFKSCKFGVEVSSLLPSPVLRLTEIGLPCELDGFGDNSSNKASSL
ncbi:hypothetical protein C0J52_19813 [Blattella germanica]|nr:hypothetical protein C0J52_19813 [Blattella germanica]